jgi:hypothetical protein
MDIRRGVYVLLLGIIVLCVGTITSTTTKYVLDGCTESNLNEYEYDSSIITYDKYGVMIINSIVKMKSNGVYYTKHISMDTYKKSKKGDTILLRERNNKVDAECINNDIVGKILIYLFVIYFSLAGLWVVYITSKPNGRYLDWSLYD